MKNSEIRLSALTARPAILLAFALILSSGLSLTGEVRNSTGPRTVSLKGVDSIYSERVKQLFLKDLEADRKNATSRLVLQRIDTPSKPLYIGLRQEMIIHAPMREVARVLDDFQQYAQLFDGLVKAEVVEKGDHYFSLFQEQTVPIPFVPDVTFTLNYYVDDSLPTQKGYLYKLKESNNLKFNDGMIRLEAISDNECYFLEYDFVFADWSILGSFANKQVWKSSIEGSLESNLVVKLKAEHPEWTPKQIKAEAKREKAKYDIDTIIATGKPADAMSL